MMNILQAFYSSLVTVLDLFTIWYHFEMVIDPSIMTIGSFLYIIIHIYHVYGFSYNEKLYAAIISCQGIIICIIKLKFKFCITNVCFIY